MRFRTVDLETTGLPSDDGGPPTGIMELAWCDYVVGEPIGKPVSMLVDCGIPVTIEARAIHHISDEMVAGELKPDEAVPKLAAGDHAYLVAHNVDHEKRYVGTGFKPGSTDELRDWICTYKPALRLWDSAPGHKLQELRYFLKLDDADDFDPKLAEPPHRAAGDAYVCAHLLRRMLQEAEKQNIDLPRLVKWSAGPGLLVLCYMKKHKGKLWSTVAREDRPYLEWIYEKSDITDRDILATAKFWLKQTAKEQLPLGDGIANPYRP